MFEKATRMKLRWSYKGLISVEDLWDLPLKDLDALYRDLNKQLKVNSEDSLLNTKSKSDEVLELSVDIIKHVVKTRQEETKAKKDKAIKDSEKEKIKEILAKKQDSELENKSVEELQSMLKD